MEKINNKKWDHLTCASLKHHHRCSQCSDKSSMGFRATTWHKSRLINHPSSLIAAIQSKQQKTCAVFCTEETSSTYFRVHYQWSGSCFRVSVCLLCKCESSQEPPLFRTCQSTYIMSLLAALQRGSTISINRPELGSLITAVSQSSIAGTTQVGDQQPDRRRRPSKWSVSAFRLRSGSFWVLENT